MKPVFEFTKGMREIDHESTARDARMALHID